MKTLLMSVLALVAATQAQAANTCSYTLDQEAYWEDASGDLTLNGVEYRCEEGEGEDDYNLCSPVNGNTNDTPYFVAFDGAEADFFVFVTAAGDNAEPVCHAIADVSDEE